MHIVTFNSNRRIIKGSKNKYNKNRDENMNFDLYKNKFEKALLDMDRDKVFSLVHTILKNCDINKFIENILVDTLKDIGEKWEYDIISLAQIYMSGKICEEIVDKIIPVKNITIDDTPKIAIATLEDHHALGKRIVKSMVISSGFRLVDYGHGIDVASLAEKVMKDNIDILLISTLMYPSALKVKDLRETFEKSNYKLKILVGGAPFVFDKSLWKQVKSDAMGESAADAIDFIKRWTEEG